MPETFHRMIEDTIRNDLHVFFSSHFPYLYVPLDQRPLICPVKVISADEMDQRKPFHPNWEVFIRMANEFIGDLKKPLDGNLFSHVVKPLQQILSMMESSPEDLQSYLREMIPAMERFLPNTHRNPPGLLHEIEDLLAELKKCQFPMIAYGIYAPGEKTIYLCYENIAKEKSIAPAILGKTVLIHEVVHALHFHAMTQRQRMAHENETKIRKSAVVETIAEFVQFYYVMNYMNGTPEMVAWMRNHPAAGFFPGWGYAGAGILLNYCGLIRERCNHQPGLSNRLIFITQQYYYGHDTSLIDDLRAAEPYFRQIYEVSLVDWRKAYSLIEALQLFSNSLV